MAVTQDRIESPATSWKPPWEAREETIGALAGGGYDTVAMDEFFALRPERAWARVAQVGRKVNQISRRCMQPVANAEAAAAECWMLHAA